MASLGPRGVRIPNRVRAAAWLAMLISVPLLGPRLLPRPCPPLPCRVLGAALLGLAMRGAQVTGRYLAVYGKSRPGLPRGELDRLVTVGPYACMRHPMHLFLSLVPLGTGLLAATLGSLLLGAAYMALVLALAVTLDERESVDRFGEDYLEYRRRVPAFSLSPSCLAKALLNPPPRRPPGLK